MKKRVSAHSKLQETTKKFKFLNEQENSEDDYNVWESPQSPIRGEMEYTYPKEDFTEDLKSQNVEAAEHALEFYNKKYRKNYQLVDALASNAMLYDGIWIHCNFTAKEQRTFDGDKDSPTKLFFAELRGIKDPPYNSVTNCRILKGSESTGCSSCETIKHPSHGFFSERIFRLGSLRPRPRRAH